MNLSQTTIRIIEALGEFDEVPNEREMDLCKIAYIAGRIDMLKEVAQDQGINLNKKGEK